MAPVLHDRVHAEYRQVDRAGAVHAGAGGGDLLEDDRGFADARSAAAVLRGYGDADPAALGHRVVERPRECVRRVGFGPVLVRELRADLSDGLADRPVLGVLAEFHDAFLPCLGARVILAGRPALSQAPCRTTFPSGGGFFLSASKHRPRWSELPQVA